LRGIAPPGDAFQSTSLAGAAGQVQASGTIRLLLLDRSASMRQTGAWDGAVRQVRELAAEAASTGDRLALAVFDREFDLLVPFATVSEASTAVEAAIKGLQPSWSGTSLDEALIQAAGLVEEQARPASQPRDRADQRFSGRGFARPAAKLCLARLGSFAYDSGDRESQGKRLASSRGRRGRGG